MLEYRESTPTVLGPSLIALQVMQVMICIKQRKHKHVLITYTSYNLIRHVIFLVNICLSLSHWYFCPVKMRQNEDAADAWHLLLCYDAKFVVGAEFTKRSHAKEYFQFTGQNEYDIKMKYIQQVSQMTWIIPFNNIIFIWLRYIIYNNDIWQIKIRYETCDRTISER